MTFGYRAKAIESHRDKEKDKLKLLLEGYKESEIKPCRDVNYIRRLQQEVQAERALRLSAENMLKYADSK